MPKSVYSFYISHHSYGPNYMSLKVPWQLRVPQGGKHILPLSSCTSVYNLKPKLFLLSPLFIREAKFFLSSFSRSFHPLQA